MVLNLIYLVICWMEEVEKEENQRKRERNSDVRMKWEVREKIIKKNKIQSYCKFGLAFLCKLLALFIYLQYFEACLPKIYLKLFFFLIIKV